MRLGLIIVGIILAVLGGVVMYVPLISQASVSVTPNSPYYATLSGYTPTGVIPGAVAWTSSSSIEVALYTCTGSVYLFQCNGSQSTHFENGSSGTMSFSIPRGGSIVVDSDGNASVSVKLAEPTLGLVVLVVGALIVILGVVLKRKPVPTSAPAPST